MKSLIIKGIQKYVEETNAKGFVIGISGGKDSTIVAKLLVEAIGKDKVLGIMMPNGVQSDINDSKRACELLGIEYMIVQIEDTYKSLINSIEYRDKDKSFNLISTGESVIVSDKSKTNIPPRLRMTTLYAIAQSIGYRVAGTGNRSERYVGWFTKHGDGGFDYNPIAPLCCTDVIKLGDELELSYDLVHKIPSDGLTGKSDEDNLGFTYEQLDNYILEGKSGDEDVDKKIENLHNLSKHKLGGGYTSAIPTRYSIVYELPWIDEENVTENMLNEMETIYVNELYDNV
jgi:NAD+ synthase